MATKKKKANVKKALQKVQGRYDKVNKAETDAGKRRKKKKAMIKSATSAASQAVDKVTKKKKTKKKVSKK